MAIQHVKCLESTHIPTGLVNTENIGECDLKPEYCVSFLSIWGQFHEDLLNIESVLACLYVSMSYQGRCIV